MSKIKYLFLFFCTTNIQAGENKEKVLQNNPDKVDLATKFSAILDYENNKEKYLTKFRKNMENQISKDTRLLSELLQQRKEMRSLPINTTRYDCFNFKRKKNLLIEEINNLNENIKSCNQNKDTLPNLLLEQDFFVQRMNSKINKNTLDKISKQIINKTDKESSFDLYRTITETLCCHTKLILKKDSLDDSLDPFSLDDIDKKKMDSLINEIKNESTFNNTELADFITERAISDSIAYLMYQSKIKNPFKCEEFSQQEINKSRKYISKFQEWKNYSTKESTVFIPGPVEKKKIKSAALIEQYTNKERYAASSKSAPSPLDLTTFRKKSNYLGIVVREMLYSLEKNKESIISEKTFKDAANKKRLVPNSFDLRTFNGLISYISNNTGKNRFAKCDYKVFYDPCGGWGERFFSALIDQHKDTRGLKKIRVNDINSNLEKQYKKLEYEYRKIKEENEVKVVNRRNEVKVVNGRIKRVCPSKFGSEKSVIFSFEDALTRDPGKNDIIFTGLPFFTLEKYAHANAEDYAKNSAEESKININFDLLAEEEGSDVKEDKQQLWVQNWLTPLIRKLINSLNPHGILAFNLGNSKSAPLAKLLKEELKNCEEYKQVTNFTQSLWGKIQYNNRADSLSSHASPIIILQKKMPTDVEPQSNPTQ